MTTISRPLVPGKNTAVMDRVRARRLMVERGLDAVIAYGGSNFFYATGFQNYFDNAAASMAVLPADERVPDFAIVANWVADAAAGAADIADIVSFPLWLEIGELEAYRAGTLSRQPKPTRFDVDGNIRLLAAELKKRELGCARIAIELGNVSSLVHAMLRHHLPEVEWVDGAGFFFELRVIKTAREIECIRTATRFAEHGLRYLAKTPLLGHDANGLKLIYEKAVIELALAQPGSGFQGTRVTNSVGGIISPTLSGGPKGTAGRSHLFRLRRVRARIWLRYGPHDLPATALL